MSIIKYIKIVGTGKYLPEKIVYSDQLEQELQVPKGWIMKYSGVRQRHIVEDESNGDLAAKALQNAFENTGLCLDDIDILISASATHDYILPYQAASILEILGAGDSHLLTSFDVNSSCQSFVNAFDIAATLLQADDSKTIAIVSAEVSSIGINKGNKETASLFGDGAAAVILKGDKQQKSGVLKSLMHTYPEGFRNSMIQGGGNRIPFKKFPYDPEIYSFGMEGRRLLRLAKKAIPRFFADFFHDLDIRIEDIDYIVPHQASRAGLSLFDHLYPGLKAKICTNLETHGNCIAASIPLCLHDAIHEGSIKRGNLCMMVGTAAGFAIGGIVFKY